MPVENLTVLNALVLLPPARWRYVYTIHGVYFPFYFGTFYGIANRSSRFQLVSCTKLIWSY